MSLAINLTKIIPITRSRRVCGVFPVSTGALMYVLEFKTSEAEHHSPAEEGHVCLKKKRRIVKPFTQIPEFKMGT